MKKYRLIAVIIGFYFIFGAVVMRFNSLSDLSNPLNPYNKPADIIIKIYGICLVIGIAAFIVHKIYCFIKYTVMKKKSNDDNITEYVIEQRSYRHKFHDED